MPSSPKGQAPESAAGAGKAEIKTPVAETAEAVNPFQLTCGGYKIGYDVESWAIRKYRTNDPFTVRRGLDDNVTEYLEHDLGYVPDKSIEDMRLWIMFFSLGFGGFAHFYPLPFQEMKPYLILCIVAYYACLGLCLYIANHLEGDHLLVARKRRTSVHQPGRLGLNSMLMTHLRAIAGFLLSLIGLNREEKEVVALPYRIRFRSRAEHFSPTYKIQAELVQRNNSRWTRPNVLVSVEEVWGIGEFFDVEGYIYPPNIKRRTDELLKKLLAEYDAKFPSASSSKKKQ
jgi:hypothetical protein